VSAAIALAAVGFQRGARTVLDQVDLEIAAGSTVALLGPSGSGKTSLLRLVLGLEPPTSGVIRLGDRAVSSNGQVIVPPEQRNLGVVFQDLALWPHLTVWRNLAFGLESLGIARGEQEARIRPMLERLGLASRARANPGELSGGERQRVAIARALVQEPCAVLLDEPLANLDAALKRDLLGLFRALFVERRCTVIYVCHDLREAAALAQRMVVLEQGRVVQDGPLATLQADPKTAFVRALVDGV
jgi:iron(III) transport system ATP-binding protein